MTFPRRKVSFSTLGRIAVLLSAGLAVLPAAAQNRRNEKEEKPEDEQLGDEWTEKIAADPREIPGVLLEYTAVELRRRFDRAKRYRLHERLRGALKKVDHPIMRHHAAGVFKLAPSSTLPAQVLMMKTIIRSGFPAPRKDRVAWLVRKLKGSHRRLSIWALRLLGQSRWPQSIDALIDTLEDEEKRKRRDGLLWHLISAELYQLLGSEAADAPAESVRKLWKKLGRKLPKTPSYSPSGAKRGSTILFFGDKISPLSVFGIDTSSSMERATRLRGARTSGESGSPDLPKVDIVKTELDRALASLKPVYRFNIVSYNAEPKPWKGRRKPTLQRANAKNIENARSFARELATLGGTNIFGALDVALRAPDLDTIYLLSDGSPSRGGGVPQIEELIRTTNYLLGVRIVTFGFAAENPEAFDENFMKKLAKQNWGRYRRLNEPSPKT